MTTQYYDYGSSAMLRRVIKNIFARPSEKAAKAAARARVHDSGNYYFRKYKYVLQDIAGKKKEMSNDIIQGVQCKCFSCDMTFPWDIRHCRSCHRKTRRRNKYKKHRIEVDRKQNAENNSNNDTTTTTTTIIINAPLAKTK
jgi:hypothetical protein